MAHLRRLRYKKKPIRIPPPVSLSLPNRPPGAHSHAAIVHLVKNLFQMLPFGNCLQNLSNIL